MKYFLLPTVVVLPDEKDFLLFRPETGMLLRLNRSGAWICARLSKGMEETELPFLLKEAGAPENALKEAQNFFTMLRGKNLLMGEKEEGRVFPPDFFRRRENPQLPDGAEIWKDSPLYDRQGMQGEFSGRESLRLQVLAPKDFRCGDILLYDAGRNRCAGKVRRVIARRETSLLVSGDAKGSPTEEIPFAKQGLFLVTQRLLPGNLRRRVFRKTAGRLRHALFFLASCLAAPAEKTMETLLPLMFWRLPMNLLIVHGEGWFCFHRKRIAWITDEGYCYLSPWYRLFYRIPAHLYQTGTPKKEFSKK